MKQNLNINLQTKEDLINQLSSITYLSEVQKIKIFEAWNNKQSLNPEALKAKLQETIASFKTENHPLKINLF
jgi:hypothetical protein